MSYTKRSVIIYLPNGNEAKFTTSKEMGGKEYRYADKIVCDPGLINIAYEEDGKIIGESYSGMPYLLEMWN